MLRLFTGLEVPADVRLELGLLQGGVWGARWIEPSDYHITLRFIGDIDERSAEEVRHALEQVDIESFTLRLQGAGAFGGEDPRSIYVKVAECAGLKRLQSSLERVCKSLGLAGESRKFLPHVSLARLKRADAGEVQRFIARHNLFHSRPFDVDRFVLFSSRPSRGGGPYGIVDSFELRAAAMRARIDARPSQR
jgi:2'-5' RNA ligase